MKLSMILGMSLNGVIGNDNALVWHYPEDLKWFRKHTTGKAIVMGRKTFESIGKPLPNRLNIILRSDGLNVPGTVSVKSMEEAIQIAEQHDHKELVIIGGKRLYEEYAYKADDIYLTRIDHHYDGNVKLEELLFEKMCQWNLTSTNAAFVHLGFDRVFCTVDYHVYAWDLNIMDRLKVDDVMLNFVHLHRCEK